MMAVLVAVVLGMCVVESFTSPGNFRVRVNSNDFQSLISKKIGHLSGTQCHMAAPWVGFRHVASSISKRYDAGCIRFKQNPWSYITIPISAALVGYITNWVGVKMLFYPVRWKGVPILRWPDQPFGLLGWQGVVPSKRIQMANRMVDVTISRLLNLKEVFARLDPTTMATILAPTVSGSVFNGCVPSPILKYFLRKACIQIVANIDNILNIKKLVVSSLTDDPKMLGQFFQTVAEKELNFLVDSGIGFGFLLGLLQMVQWFFFPADWTLPVAGALVGYVTNWIALKWIFEPLNPTKIGPFMIQGMFLKRQKEVSQDFCNELTKETLTSANLWKSILFDVQSKLKVQTILEQNVPLPSDTIKNIIITLQDTVGRDFSHPIHKYTDSMLKLKTTLVKAMNLLSSIEFERVLHPIFEEDEVILILAGAVLGAISGALQIGLNFIIDNWGKFK